MLFAIGIILALLPIIYLLVEGFQEEDDRQRKLDQIQVRLSEKDSEKALDVINNLRDYPICIGDLVKITDAPATRAIGASGKYGVVLQAAIPSTKELEIVGTSFADAALSVFVDDLNKRVWLYPDLVTNVSSGDA